MLGLDKYLILGAAVALLAAGAFITYQTNEIDRLELDNAILEERVGDKDATIDAQNKGIAALTAEAKAAEKRILDAGSRIDALNTDLAAARAKRNAAVEKDYALPDCQALLATDLAAVCPAHARRLRDAARGVPRPAG